MANRARDWLRQAREEALWMADSRTSERWALVCFMAQQVAEKSLKAIGMSRGAEQIKSHSVREIALALDIDGDLTEKAKILDQYYIATRDPDVFYSGSPFEYFTRDQADRAIGFARDFLERAEAEIAGDEG